jgi:hypothetical protein
VDGVGLLAIRGIFPASTPVPAAVVGAVVVVVVVLGGVVVMVVGVVVVIGCVCMTGSGTGAGVEFKANQTPTLPIRASSPVPKSTGVDTLGRFMPCFLGGAV